MGPKPLCFGPINSKTMWFKALPIISLFSCHMQAPILDQQVPTKNYIVKSDTISFTISESKMISSYNMWMGFDSKLISIPFDNSHQIAISIDGKIENNYNILPDSISDLQWTIRNGLFSQKEYDQENTNIVSHGYNRSFVCSKSSIMSNQYVIRCYVPKYHEKDTTTYLEALDAVVDRHKASLCPVDMSSLYSMDYSSGSIRSFHLNDTSIWFNIFGTNPHSVNSMFASFRNRNGKYEPTIVPGITLPSTFDQAGKGYVNSNGFFAGSAYFFAMTPLYIELRNGKLDTLEIDGLDPLDCLNNPGPLFMISDVHSIDGTIHLIYNSKGTSFLIKLSAGKIISRSMFGVNLNPSSICFVDKSTIVGLASDNRHFFRWRYE